MVTWEPSSLSDRSADPRFAPRQIARGKLDRYLHESAAQVRSWGRPLMIRFAHEMNGSWVPWGAGVGGTRPRDQIAAWRHVVRIFRAEGASNARFVWSPNVDWGGHPFEPMFPGDKWVDLGCPRWLQLRDRSCRRTLDVVRGRVRGIVSAAYCPLAAASHDRGNRLDGEGWRQGRLDPGCIAGSGASSHATNQGDPLVQLQPPGAGLARYFLADRRRCLPRRRALASVLVDILRTLAFRYSP